MKKPHDKMNAEEKFLKTERLNIMFDPGPADLPEELREKIAEANKLDPPLVEMTNEDKKEFLERAKEKEDVNIEDYALGGPKEHDWKTDPEQIDELRGIEHRIMTG